MFETVSKSGEDRLDNRSNQIISKGQGMTLLMNSKMETDQFIIDFADHITTVLSIEELRAISQALLDIGLPQAWPLEQPGFATAEFDSAISISSFVPLIVGSTISTTG